MSSPLPALQEQVSQQTPVTPPFWQLWLPTLGRFATRAALRNMAVSCRRQFQSLAPRTRQWGLVAAAVLCLVTVGVYGSEFAVRWIMVAAGVLCLVTMAAIGTVTSRRKSSAAAPHDNQSRPLRKDVPAQFYILMKQGRDALNAKRHYDAISAFSQAQALVPGMVPEEKVAADLLDQAEQLAKLNYNNDPVKG